jgi:hypothetical protein
MKWLILLALLMPTVPATATELAEPPTGWFLPADFVWPTGLFKTVLVTRRGESPQLARADAFRTAVEQVAGVTVTSSTEVNMFRLSHDQTHTYTQARVTAFAVVTVHKVNGVWLCQMWATVTGS